MTQSPSFPAPFRSEPDFTFHGEGGVVVSFAVAAQSIPPDSPSKTGDRANADEKNAATGPSVTGPRMPIILACASGSFAASGGKWTQQLALVAEACLGAQVPFALVLDVERVAPVDLATRLALLDSLRSLPQLRACAFAGQGRLLRTLIELGLAFQAPPFPVCCRADRSQAVEAVGERDISVAPNPGVDGLRHAVPNQPESLLGLFAGIPWAQAGGEIPVSIAEGNPWRPVADALTLIKRDLDLLVEARRARTKSLREEIAEAQALRAGRQRALDDSESLRARLEEEGRRRLALGQDLVRQQKDLLFSLGEVIETRSRETANHIRRVSEYARHLAVLCGYPEREADLVLHATPMHDAGKLAIPDHILTKPGLLEPEERAVMEDHARLGHELLRGGQRDILGAASRIAHEHHERWNGKGYPRRLQGAAIHPYGRIAALADVFDALGSDRCYKKAWPLPRILDFLHAERGGHFEPRLVDLFFKHLGAFRQIRDAYPDDAA